MKSLLLILLALIIVPKTAVSGATPTRQNPWVRSAISVVPAKVHAGSAVNLKVLLTPKAGIHIVVQPPIGVTLDSSAVVASAAKPEVPVAKDNEHLDSAKPITVAVTLAGNVKPGKVSVKGMLVYYYCSDAEGTCNKFKEPFEVRLNVVR
jgi:hypothetical protein